ncbi:protein HIDE1 [Microcaecilia unicolor]|uniref:Protein HIDE1-like n=1 Tax=Microcaecilia unicolor TaxID=1415580 RepID=A0A6P7XBD5_9AMPH|nr:protein HIDE1-like [Microcaecilia unicolor]
MHLWKLSTMPTVTTDLLLEHSQTTNYSALPPASIPPPGSAWLVPVSVSSATGLLLILSLVLMVLAIRRVKSSRRQKEREKESCWTQNTNTYPIDLTFDNLVFADPVSQSHSSDPEASPGPLSVSSLQFSTFRS